jgi:uncharacterized protein YkwD
MTDVSDLDVRVRSPSLDWWDLDVMLVLVNLERSRIGVPPLHRDERLDRIADGHLRYLVKKKKSKLSHEGPKKKPGIAERLRAGGISYSWGGENIGRAPTPLLAVHALMQSSGHRENILDANFNRIGLACAPDRRSYYHSALFCQVFTD